ncbi:MAG TPA: putative 2OG-Fe(II) oxygenase [Magnetospirillaceae bacterium]|jgi:tetratricopeptide (TPR) repeat protein
MTVTNRAPIEAQVVNQSSPVQRHGGEVDAAEMVMAAQAAHQNGNPERAAALYRIALDNLSGPARYPALLGLASAECDSGLFNAAERACRQAIAEMPDLHIGHTLLASVLLDLGRADDAAEAIYASLQRAPGDLSLLNLAAGIALRRGRPDEARKLTEASLAIMPTNQRAVAHLAIAFAQLGVDQAVARLLDFDRLLKVTTIAPPPGFVSATDFNRAVTESLVNRSDLSLRHIARTMIGGARLEDTFALDAHVANPLRQMFVNAALDYAAKLSVDVNHPVALGRPAAFTIMSWSNIMESAAYELPHIHEKAWISGVYYPEVVIDRPLADDAGAIEFGGHDFGDALSTLGPTRQVMPQSGTLVMFPSYFYHRTIPFEGNGRRISIAFDIKAVQSGR